MTEPAQEDHLALLGERAVHGGEDVLPVALLFGQLSASGGGQCVHFHSALRFGFRPVTLGPAFFGEPVKRGEKRSRTNEKDAASDLFDAVGDADAVQRTEFQSSENQKVEGARQDVGWFRHGSMISIDDIDCQHLFCIAEWGKRTQTSSPCPIAIGRSAIDLLLRVDNSQIDPRAALLRRYARAHTIQRHMQIVVVEVHKQLLKDLVPNLALSQHEQ